MYIKDLGFEVKTSTVAFKDIDTKKGIVVGYFSCFNSKDSDGDIILPGAYTKSITERGPKSAKPRIKHLLDHNKTKAVAVIQDLEEDAIGLKYESKAGRHKDGQDWLLMCEDGIITEHSVGFETIKEDKKSDANYMSELLLWEGSSLQSWGANSSTPIVGIKSLKIEELNSRFELIEKCIRNGKYSDEVFPQLDKELKAIKHLLSILTLDTTEPEHTISATTQPGLKEESELLDTLTNYLNNLKSSNNSGTERTNPNPRLDQV
jgi:HK97 family phage prohead protease